MDRSRRNDHRRSDGGRKLCCCGGVRSHQERSPPILLSEETRRRSFVRLPTEGTTFLRLSKLPDFRPEIAVAAVLTFAPFETRGRSARAKLEHGRRYLVVDCLNTKLPKSLNVVLHGLKRFGGVPLPICDLARDP